jgi:TolB-like protein/Flp pilus assembly protein TadD/predicted Ser/Thr protein kinase
MVGQTIGHYEIEALVGAGGMGVVYRARDTYLRRTVALKLVASEHADAAARKRLLDEARAVSSLNHPNICTIHEVVDAGDQLCIVMEYVDGQPLAKLFRSGEGLPSEVIIRYGSQIADALAHAHQRGIVHRDLKSANVVITADGRVKVLDFGLAIRLESGQVTDTIAPTMTQSDEHRFAGTIPYMAPEVLRGDSATARSDIWALGVMLYEMISGDRPFSGKTGYEITAAVLHEPAPALPSNVTHALDTIVQRCLAKAPSDRYELAGEVRAALETAGLQRPVIQAVKRRFVMSEWRRIVLVLTFAAILGPGGWYLARHRAAGIQSAGSIAVVPLASATGTAESDALSDGITESVINSLGQLPEVRLKVIALSSVLRFKGRTIDPQSVGRELGVGTILTLRIVPQPNALSIGAQLVSTSDGSLVWGETYQTALANVFGTEEDIARKTIQHLRIGLSGEQERRVTKRYTENTEAYQLYSRGLYYSYKQAGTTVNYERSIEYFQQAIEKDPAYALAYVGLAQTYIGMGFEGWMPPQQALENAQTAVTKALVLEASIVNASPVLGNLKNFQWDLPGSEVAYRRAIGLNPTDEKLHKYYSQQLRATGRWEEAIAEGRRAQELDPLGVETNTALGVTYFWAGQIDRAIDQYRKTLELEPGSAEIHDLLADAYARKGMHEEAIGELRQTLAFNDADTLGIALVADYVSSGYEEAIKNFNRGQLAAAIERSKVGYVSPMEFATRYTSLGDRNQAFIWLEKAVDERSPWLYFLKTDPAFETLRGDPRFTALLHRIGLPV